MEFFICIHNTKLRKRIRDIQEFFLSRRGDLLSRRGDLHLAVATYISPWRLTSRRGDLLSRRGDLLYRRGDLLSRRGDLLCRRGDLPSRRGELHISC